MKALDGKKYLIPKEIDNLSNQSIDPIIRDRENTLDITDKMRVQFKDD